jgi:hypothetical protein
LFYKLLFHNHSANANLPTSQITGTRCFLAAGFSQVLLFQITMESCSSLFSHLGLPTLQNSTQLSNANSLIQFFSPPLLATNSCYMDSAQTTQKILTCQTACLLVRSQHLAWRGPHRKHLSFINTRQGPQQKTRRHCCLTSPHTRECI